MAPSFSSRKQKPKIYRVVMLWLYPRLREIPPERWESMLAKARSSDFNTAELVATIGGVGLVAWLLGIGFPETASQASFIAHLLQFILALPLLAVIVGPIYLRRTRRGLERELAHGKSTRAGNANAPFQSEG